MMTSSLRTGSDPCDLADEVDADAVGMMLALVADGHRLARGEGLGLELLADPADDVVVALARAGEDIRDDGLADVVIDEPLDVGVVGVADGPVVVDHPGRPVGRGVLELVLMEGIGAPLLEELERLFAGADRDLGLHEHDLALDVDALVVVVAELGRGDAVADIDDLGRDLAGARRAAGHELVLVLVGLLDDTVLAGRHIQLADAARENDGVRVREELPVGPVLAAGLDAPALEQGLDPLDAGLVLLGAGQTAAVLLGDHLLDVVVKRLALDEVHGFEDLGLVGRRGRGLAGRLGGEGEPREYEPEGENGQGTARQLHVDASFKKLNCNPSPGVCQVKTCGRTSARPDLIRPPDSAILASSDRYQGGSHDPSHPSRPRRRVLIRRRPGPGPGAGRQSQGPAQDVHGRHHPRALSGQGADHGQEHPGLRRRQVLRRPHLPPRHPQLHDPDRRADGRHDEQGGQRPDQERIRQRPEERPRHRGHGPDERPRQRDQPVLHQPRRQLQSRRR